MQLLKVFVEIFFEGEDWCTARGSSCAVQVDDGEGGEDGDACYYKFYMQFDVSPRVC